MKKIIMTGGGSAGHVTPNIALIPSLKKEGYEIVYVGSINGIEKEIIEKTNIKYYGISSGKLRRYFDLKNFSDPFKVIKGFFEAYSIIKREKPSVIFSKGGFVSVPVVIAGHFNKVPVVIHESDMTPGLANKLSMPYCTKVCVTFPECIPHFPKEKVVLTGSPIRAELLNGSKILGKKFLNFKEDKPILMVIGGSLGSKIINNAIIKDLNEILKSYNVVHICGKGNIDKAINNLEGYRQYEYLEEELKDVMNASDIFISRAGSNVIFELLALKKPNILIPLSKESSRGDQILNAESFKKSGYSKVVIEEELQKINLKEEIDILYREKEGYISNMQKSPLKNSVGEIIKVLDELVRWLFL